MTLGIEVFGNEGWKVVEFVRARIYGVPESTGSKFVIISCIENEGCRIIDEPIPFFRTDMRTLTKRDVNVFFECNDLFFELHFYALKRQVVVKRGFVIKSGMKKLFNSRDEFLNILWRPADSGVKTLR